MRKKDTARNSAMRLLTLVCFFHFSGLNNGMTHVVFYSGKIERVDCVPLVMENFGKFLASVHWKKFLTEKGWTALFHRSNRMIGVVSQRAIQNMLIEASFFRVWVEHSMLEAISCKNNGHGRVVIPAQTPLSRGGIQRHFPLKNWNPVPDRGIRGQAPAGMTTVRQLIRFLGTGDREETWIQLEQFHLGGGKKCRFVPKFLSHARWKWREKDTWPGSLYSKRRLRKFAKLERERVRRRIIYFEGGRGDDAPADFLMRQEWVQL